MNVIHRSDPRLSRLLQSQKTRQGVEYVPSQFTLPFSHGKSSYVFHTLTKECAEVVLPSFCRAGEGYDELLERYYLVPRDKDECAFYENVLHLMRTFYNSEFCPLYTILPTLACNARCVYCYEAGTVPETMTEETAKQTVRYILNTRQKDKPVMILWFGGEPLLREKIIDQICRSLQDEGVKYISSMITNGSLITREIVEKMKSLWNLTNLQISMDGAEEDYLKRKRYCAPDNQYHRVMEAISMMSAEGIRVSVRCNVDGENLPRIPRFLDEMRAGVVNKDNVTVFLVPLDEMRSGENGFALWKEIQSMAPLIEKAGFKRVFEGDGTLRFRIFHCSSETGDPVIGPRGSLHPCKHCLNSQIGDIWNGISDAVKNLRAHRSEHILEKCRTCPFLPLCTPFDGCPVKDRECREVNRLFTMERLFRLAEEANQPDPDAPQSAGVIYSC